MRPLGITVFLSALACTPGDRMKQLFFLTCKCVCDGVLCGGCRLCEGSGATVVTHEWKGRRGEARGWTCTSEFIKILSLYEAVKKLTASLQ